MCTPKPHTRRCDGTLLKKNKNNKEFLTFMQHRRILDIWRLKVQFTLLRALHDLEMLANEVQMNTMQYWMAHWYDSKLFDRVWHVTTQHNLTRSNSIQQYDTIWNMVSKHDFKSGAQPCYWKTNRTHRWNVQVNCKAFFVNNNREHKNSQNDNNIIYRNNFRDDISFRNLIVTGPKFDWHVSNREPHSESNEPKHKD